MTHIQHLIHRFALFNLLSLTAVLILAGPFSNVFQPPFIIETDKLTCKVYIDLNAIHSLDIKTKIVLNESKKKIIFNKSFSIFRKLLNNMPDNYFSNEMILLIMFLCNIQLQTMV